MKFNFKIQPYQTDAVNAVVKVFTGQGLHQHTTYRRDLGKQAEAETQATFMEDEFGETLDANDYTGYRNEPVALSDAQLLQNIQRLQQENNIHEDAALVKKLGRVNLDVEMETGTGKTYVYIKTMFELNKQYGWSKFIVVVPSIAIREGVYKSFEYTAEHFMQHYKKKARFFIYNSSNLNQLDTFSSSAGINVMIINTQAFAASMNEAKNVEGRKGDAAARIIYSKRDEFGSRRPIDVIAANNPIIILDEPQKMGGEVTQKALKNFNPLFTINYSATHKEQHNLVYVLDALEAYNQRLVKRIEVKGFEVKNLRGTDHYMFLEEIVLSKNKPPMAKIEMEIGYHKSTNRETRILGVGDSLYAASKEMEQYKGYVISEIDPLRATVTFTNGVTIFKGDVVGDVSEKDMRRIQIRETIISHFENMFKRNPEEFISKTILMINEQKATMVIDHITYDMTSGTYDNDIFTAEKSSQSIDKAFKATKAIQDYVFTDGSAVDSVEMKFATALDAAAEVCVYAKLPRGFAIPTPVGNYSPDWAIAFNAGTVKHIYFIAETKGSLDSMVFNHISPLEQAKINCAKALFRQINSGSVKYGVVDSYQSLLNLMIGQ